MTNLSFGIILAVILSHFGHLTALNRLQLFNDVIYAMNPDIAPFESASTGTIVTITVNLMSITDINEKQQTMSGSYWVVLGWGDYRLRWNPNLYHNISSLQVNADRIWSPKSICVYNEIGNDKCFNAKTDPVTVYSAGFAVYMKHTESVIQCAVDVTAYPFDSQECVLVFGNFNSISEFLQFNEKYSNFDLQYLQPNEIWDIQNITFYIHDFYDPVNKITQEHFRFSIHLKRKSFYAVISSLLPVLVLSVLNLFCFVVPIESGEKMGFCMAIFLTYAVFLTIINDSMPKSSEKVPYFTVYLITQLVISGLVVILESIVLFAHFHFCPVKDLERKENGKYLSSQKKRNGAHLDVIFFLIIFLCDIVSFIFYIVNVL
jgi:hypothetical protein